MFWKESKKRKKNKKIFDEGFGLGFEKTLYKIGYDFGVDNAKIYGELLKEGDKKKDKK
jgi:hypothetical protein